MGRKPTRNYKNERVNDEEEVEKTDDEELEDDDDAGDEDEDADLDADPEADLEADIEADIDDEDLGDDDDEDAPKKKKKKVVKKKAATTKRTRTPKVVPMKMVWIVYDNSSKQIETFPYNQQAEAEALLNEKNTEKKGFYIQKVKVPLDEK